MGFFDNQYRVTLGMELAARRAALDDLEPGTLVSGVDPRGFKCKGYVTRMHRGPDAAKHAVYAGKPCYVVKGGLASYADWQHYDRGPGGQHGSYVTRESLVVLELPPKTRFTVADPWPEAGQSIKVYGVDHTLTDASVKEGDTLTVRNLIPSDERPGMIVGTVHRDGGSLVAVRFHEWEHAELVPAKGMWVELTEVAPPRNKGDTAPRKVGDKFVVTEAKPSDWPGNWVYVKGEGDEVGTVGRVKECKPAPYLPKAGERVKIIAAYCSARSTVGRTVTVADAYPAVEGWVMISSRELVPMLSGNFVRVAPVQVELCEAPAKQAQTGDVPKVGDLVEILEVCDQPGGMRRNPRICVGGKCYVYEVFDYSHEGNGPKVILHGDSFNGGVMVRCKVLKAATPAKPARGQRTEDIQVGDWVTVTDRNGADLAEGGGAAYKVTFVRPERPGRFDCCLAGTERSASSRRNYWVALGLERVDP